MLTVSRNRTAKLNDDGNGDTNGEGDNECNENDESYGDSKGENKKVIITAKVAIVEDVTATVTMIIGEYDDNGEND